MSTNPHYEAALSCYHTVNVDAAQEFNDGVRADALIQATLAVAWETGRLADEQRTANLIAGLHPVELLGKRTWYCNEETLFRVRDEISRRLYPKGADQ